MTKFKEGDTVRIKNRSCSQVKLGEKSTLHYGLKNGDQKDILIAWSASTTTGGCSCESNWELIEEKKETHVFKVGDRIRIIEDCKDSVGVMKGEEYTVILCKCRDLKIGSENCFEQGCHHTEKWKLVDKEPNLLGNYSSIMYNNYRLNTDFAFFQPRASGTSKTKKVMSIIKDAFKSKEDKALSKYEITNGDGGLTPNGREEFIDYMWETMKDERKAFTDKIIEKMDEDKKCK